MTLVDSQLPQPSSAVSGKKRTRLNWHLRVPLRASRRTAIKNHFVAAVGEFVGTTLFLFFALGGTNVANIPSVSITDSVNTSQIQFIALSFGFSLAVNAWVFFRISGGLFNPAVSLGLAIVGAITPLRALILTLAQILGGITGAALIQVVLPGSLNVRTTLAGGISTAQGLFLEMFLTSMLMLTILLLAAEKHKATFLAPIGIGLALFIAELVGVFYTGGSLNPCRSFGPDVVLGQFAPYHWIYWLGPALGACLAAGFYKFIKFMQYETVNADQDAANEPMLPTAGRSGTPSGQLEMAERTRKPFLVARMSSSILQTVGAGGTASNSQADLHNRDDSHSAPVQGPGIGDLLTEAVQGTAVFELASDPANAVESSSHLSELERKIDLILESLNQSSNVRRIFPARDLISEEPPLALFEEGRSFNFGDDSSRRTSGELSGGPLREDGIRPLGRKL